MHYTGTMKNGLVPTQCKQDPRTKRMRRGQSYSWSNSTCSLVIWKDSAKFFTISTAHDGNQTVPVLRYVKAAGVWVQIQAQSPVPCQEYTEKMGGIDRFNSLTGAYLPRFRVMKWVQAIFREATCMCAANAYVIHKLLGGKKVHYKFHKMLVRGMIEQGKRDMLGERLLPSDVPAPLSRDLNTRRLQRPGEHSRITHPGGKSGRCRLCQARGYGTGLNIKFSCTRSWCSVCEVFLCSPRTGRVCFVTWHTRPDMQLTSELSPTPQRGRPKKRARLSPPPLQPPAPAVQHAAILPPLPLTDALIFAIMPQAPFLPVEVGPPPTSAFGVYSVKRADFTKLRWKGPHNTECEFCSEVGLVLECDICNLCVHAGCLTPPQPPNFTEPRPGYPVGRGRRLVFACCKECMTEVTSTCDATVYPRL